MQVLKNAICLHSICYDVYLKIPFLYYLGTNRNFSEGSLSGFLFPSPRFGIQKWRTILHACSWRKARTDGLLKNVLFFRNFGRKLS